MPNNQVDIKYFRYQQQYCDFPWQYPELRNIFLLGGYGCGKTHADRNMLWNIYKRYHNYPVEVIVAGVTITLLRKTLIKMFIQLLNECKIPYKDNSKLNCIQVDKMYFYMLGMDQPENIFAYNGSIFIADELDELPQDTAIEAFAALQERTRIVLPDKRGPFGCISTTAQGLKGVYRVTESLKEKKRKYCIIRGATRENTTLAADYLENLESLYDENERMAYLEGKFVNLSSGRVYGNYDESINMWRGEPIVLKENETVYVGQDFNAGFNKAVAVVDRFGELVAFKEFSFKQISDAPTMLRASFPNNRIVWFPDASGKELLAGYASEIRRANIELRFASFNPSIVERIFFVNKLFKTRRLYITSDCTMLSMALKTRQFDDTGKPEKGKGEKAPDHVCFVGDTLISTITGDKPIKDVHIGDLVLTRKGYKRVINAGVTGVKEAFKYTLNGVELGATKDHPVWTKKGFKAIAELHPGDTLCTLALTDFFEEVLLNSEEPVSLGVQPVYNLTVEHEHEYFANGVLVSNCDCFEYVLYRLVFWLPYFRDLLKASPEKDTRDGKYIAGGA